VSFDLPPEYKQVPERMADLKAAHPDARLRPVNPEKPFEVVTIGDKTFIAYAAACYRDADDQLPGIGVAWEPFPGKTPYTKDSELMNAETSAWGRAIVACLRSEAKSIASAEEVRNRRADRESARRPWWQTAGYIDEEQGQATVDRLNAAMRQVSAGRREPVRAWLVENGYAAKVPLVVRADHVAELEAVLTEALGAPEYGPGEEPFEEVSA
jgi:hypothetical protein